MTLGRTGDELIGKMLGSFEIMEEIGRGGMATVYRARQTTMNRVVAVKVLPRNLLHDPGFYERFEREVEVISHLEHPHIVPIYEYGQSEGMPYIVMRYLGGGSLENVIRRGLPAIGDLEKPLRQIGQALDYAHQQGIIHRDLKPGNIMLDENGNAYLSDFGIARVLGSNMTGSMIVGTPAYMSPEQAHGISIDGRSDIYALGVVLFELLTGREPYQADTPMAVLLKHINEPIPSIRDYRADVPVGVEAVMRKATEKDPDDRYASATAMMNALAAALRGETLPEAARLERPTTPPIANPIPKPSQVNAPAVTTGEMRGVSTRMLETHPSRGLLVPLLIGALVGGVVLVIALSLLTANGDDNTVVVDAVPTAFVNAEELAGANYTISMPDLWIPLGDYVDESDDRRQLHRWFERSQSPYGEALSVFVTLALVEADTSSDEAFASEVAQYQQRYYIRERENW
ncbi:MAG: serine/threonine protein kinase, partial [Armatimonadetes bacterium]|nr:serine/threonine protein kinase [Anaerolineae bacterium]